VWCRNTNVLSIVGPLSVYEHRLWQLLVWLEWRCGAFKYCMYCNVFFSAIVQLAKSSTMFYNAKYVWSMYVGLHR
jgi:hypothetical protein